jgi:hypothetical protein
MPTHEEHISNRVDAISRLRDKHDMRRKAQRDQHSRELAAARSKAPMAGDYVPQREPESRQPTYVIWKDLDSARQQAVRGVFESTAKLRANADADILNMNKTAGRYMGQSSTRTTRSRVPSVRTWISTRRSTRTWRCWKANSGAS